MVFLTIFFIPVLVALGFLLFGKVTGKEFAAQVAGIAVLAGICAAICYYGKTTDREVWNGSVTAKAREVVSCEHSYSCNCRESCSGSGSSRSCSTTCDTCYDHAYDVDWAVYTSLNERYRIDRIDRQGVDEPPRWAQVYTGEPTSSTHLYTNYIKGAPDSLFSSQGDFSQYKGSIPAYPITVYDYFHLDRVLTVGVGLSDIRDWNARLEKLNAALGHDKQVNIIFIITTYPREWKYAVEREWIGGKKNDAVIFMGLDPAGNVIWSDVMAWSMTSEFAVKTRDALANSGHLDPNNVFPIVGETVSKYYHRKPMHDFEYLEASIKPSMGEYLVCIFVCVILTVISSVLLQDNDVFHEKTSYSYGRNGRYSARQDYYR